MSVPTYKPLTIGFAKTHPDAKLPSKIRPSDTGYDLFAVEDVVVPGCKVFPPKAFCESEGCPEEECESCGVAFLEAEVGSAIIPTGITVAKVPMGVWYRVEPRSGMGFKHGIQPHLGVIDNCYRGDLGVKLYNFSRNDYVVKKGDKIAQIAFYPLISIDPVWSESVEETDRGADGFGSSGK